MAEKNFMDKNQDSVPVYANEIQNSMFLSLIKKLSLGG